MDDVDLSEYTDAQGNLYRLEEIEMKRQGVVIRRSRCMMMVNKEAPPE